MKKGFKLIVPSFLAIIVCILLLAGSTFALFTSDVTKNIVVGSATVNMEAEYTEFKAYSVVPDDNGTDGEATAYGVTSNYKYSTEDVETVVANSSYIFANKGTAKLTGENTIELVNVTPGDRITANLKVTNNSNVDIIYRVRLNAISDNGLLDGLSVSVDDVLFEGIIKVEAWKTWNVPTNDDDKVRNISLEVVLPVDKGNEYQTKSATLRFTIEAVQANAKTDTLLDQVNASLAGSAKVNKTMYDAIQEAETAYSTFDGSKYLWSPDTDQFYAPYTVVAGFESHFFKAYSQAEFNELTEQKYNIYATGEWTGIGSTNPVNITVGFDAGEATGLTHISYVRNQESDKAQEVIIRTNSANTNLVIDAPKDIVHHYGDAGSLTIISVAGQSYHENGNVGFLEIKNGRVALETNSTVQQIHLSTTTINAGTETEDKVFDNIVIAKAEDVEMPAFSRDPVEIPEDGKLVVALQSSTEEEADKDYVWLTAIGVYEQVTVSDSSTSAGETYASEMTAQTTEEAEVQKVADQKQAAQQIANNISVGLGTDTYTVTAQKNETTGDWEYSLQGETQEATQAVADYTVTVEKVEVEQVQTTQVTVVNNESPETPVETTTTVQNGVTAEEKEVQKESVVDEMKYKDYINSGYSFVVGNTGYRTLKEAFDNVEDNQTINLIQNLDFKVSVDEITDETHTNWFGSGFSNGHIKSYIHLNNKKGIIFNLNGFTMNVDYTLNFLDHYNSNERVAKKVFIYLSGEGSLLITNGTMNVKFDYKNRAATANGTSAYNSSYEYSAIYVHNNPASPGSKNENVTYDIPYQTELSIINCSITSNQVPLRLHHGAIVKELNANIMYYCENAEKVSEGKSTNVNIYNVQNNNNHCIHLMAGSKIEKITGGSYICCDQRELDDPYFPMQNQGSALYVTEGFRASATYYPQVYVPRAEVGEISGGVFKSNGAYPVEIKGYVEKISGGLFYRIEGTYAGRNTMYFNPTIVVSHPDDNAGIGCITGGTFIGGSNPNRPDGLNNIIAQRPKGGSGSMTYPSLANYLGEGYTAHLNESLSYDVTTSRTTDPIVIRCYAYDVLEASE